MRAVFAYQKKINLETKKKSRLIIAPSFSPGPSRELTKVLAEAKFPEV